VNTDGYLEDIAIVRSGGGGLDNASLAVIQSMNDLPQPPFVPGQQLGVPVKVKYTLPIRFKLESNNSSLYQKRKSKRANTN
jgi:protein TonB